jgi:hypothetical protein
MLPLIVRKNRIKSGQKILPNLMNAAEPQSGDFAFSFSAECKIGVA